MKFFQSSVDLRDIAEEKMKHVHPYSSFRPSPNHSNASTQQLSSKHVNYQEHLFAR